MEKEKTINNKKKSNQPKDKINYNKDELTKQINTLKQEIQTKNDLLNNLLQKEKDVQNLNQIQDELSNIKSINNKLQYEIDQLKLEKAQHIKTIEELNSQIVSNKTELLNLNNQISKNELVENNNTDLIKKMVAIQDILSMKEAEIISLKKLNNELSQTNAILVKQNNDYKLIFNQQENNHNEINQKIESYHSKISELLKLNNNANNEIALLRNKNCELMRDNKIMKDSLKQIKIENDSLLKEINEQTKNISINEKKKDDLEIQNKNNEIQIQKHLQKITLLSKEQIGLEENIKNLNAKVTKYENDIMDMKSMLIKQKELNNTINNEKNELINKRLIQTKN